MWRTRGALAAAVAVLGGAGVGGLWAVGGLATAADSTLSWTTTGAAKLPMLTHEACGVSMGGKIYTFGGYDIEKVKASNQWTPRPRSAAYTPTTNSWADIAALPAYGSSAAPGITHCGAATDGTNAYVIGGFPSNAAATGQTFGTKWGYKYSSITNTYTRLPDLPSARGAGAAAYADGKLHFFGGIDSARNASTSHWELDPAAANPTWVPRAPLPAPRNHLNSAIVGGKIYAVGGQLGENAPAVSSSRVDVYEPSTDTWRTIPPMPQVLSHLSVTESGGLLVVLGGEPAFTKQVNTVYAYDPATNAWSQLTSLPAIRSTGIAASINGVLWYAGGSRGNILYKGTPAPSGSGGATPTPVVTPTATPVATPTATPVVTPTPTPVITPVPTPTATPVVTPTPGTTPTPDPAEPTPTATPEVTPTPTPTATPVVTATPTPGPTATTYSINFGPAGSAVPAGDTLDSGAPYAPAVGRGWVRADSLTAATPTPLDVSSRARERNASADQRLDTFIQMQFPASDPEAAYELALPNGRYEVTVTVGDPSYVNSTHTVRAEGQPVINAFVPTSSMRSKVATANVNVTDGRLTLDAVGGTNTKIDHLEVHPAAPVGMSSWSINFGPAGSPSPAGDTLDSGAGYDAVARRGWVRADSLSQPVPLPIAATTRTRKRNAVADLRLDSFMQLQYPATDPELAYEVDVEPGSYLVTVSVGDAGYTNSVHTIRAEGQLIVDRFQPTTSTKFRTVTATISVTDGRLTLDATGGTNTKLDYLGVQPAA